jgi:hypothetical protein
VTFHGLERLLRQQLRGVKCLLVRKKEAERFVLDTPPHAYPPDPCIRGVVNVDFLPTSIRPPVTAAGVGKGWKGWGRVL